MKNNKGAAMIVVLVVICLLTFFSFALLLSSSILVSTATLTATDEQCKISAVTFSKVIQNLLTSPYEMSERENNELRAWIRENIEGTAKEIGKGPWVYFNDEEAGHGMDMALAEINFGTFPQEKNIGKITANMYWEYESTNDSASLYVAVTCELRGRFHKITTQYQLTKEEDNSTGFMKWIWKEVWRS